MQRRSTVAAALREETCLLKLSFRSAAILKFAAVA